ncbi:lipopolysaccharide-binding protein-like [Clytia hemisphaerica]|uniref:lipopolysaccharide-binding protein-like n=1 Tax=Clytia hemisphaerica TaxID=252671 RepID=UPI0034D5936B
MKIFLGLLFAVLFVQNVYCVDRGVQLRITRKALEYALDVEIEKVQESIRSKSFDQRGQSGRTSWSVYNTRIQQLNFPNKDLQPIGGRGIRASVSNAYIQISGRAHYRYKRGWFKISDSIDLTVKASRLRFSLDILIGRDGNGVPNIRTTGCSSDLSVDVDFHGGKAWIYNAFAGVFEGKLRDVLRQALCESARRGIDRNARDELRTFKVERDIDPVAKLDYRLTANPTYTSQYVDFYLKGEFTSRYNPQPNGIAFTSFATNSDSTKMLYAWISEYTANTAAKVYHDAGRLDTSLNAWDPKDPEKPREKLNTKFLKYYAPEIYKKYPDMPIGIRFTSYRQPFVKISPQGILCHIFMRAMFKVRDEKTQKLTDVLGINFNINASVSITVNNEKIIPKIEPRMKYHAVVDKPFRNLLQIDLNSNFVYGMLYYVISSKLNPKLERGLDIPKMDNIELRNADIQLIQGAVRIGLDIKKK